jgi:hypothetical protein
MKSTQSKQARLTEAFLAGQELTVGQIKSRYGIANPTATISEIRFAGYAIYANKRKNSVGEVHTKYRLGTPTRKVVAAGYRALAQGLVA